MVFTFANWSGDASGTTNPVTVTISGNTNVTANFTQNEYALDVVINPSGSGSVTKNPDHPTYHYGDEVTMTATASDGFTFANWSGDASGTTNPVTVTISGYTNVTANFIPPIYFPLFFR